MKMGLVRSEGWLVMRVGVGEVSLDQVGIG